MTLFVNSLLQSPNITMTAETVKPFSRLDYRNAIYQGCLQANQRNGFGILLTDGSQIIIADWAANQIQGRYCYIAERVKAYGQVHNRKLEGVNVIEANGVSVFAEFKQGQLNGKVVVTHQQNYSSLTFTKGKLTNQSQPKQISQTSLAKLLHREYPQTVLNLSNFLTRMSESNIASGILFGQTQLSETDTYFGIVDKNCKGQGIGCVIRNLSELYSCGVYENNQLNGLGRVYLHQSCVEDGVFNKGKAKGVMITHNRIESQYTVLINGNRKTQKGNPQRLINQIRRQFHLRSAVFTNQYVISDLLLGINFDKFLKEQTLFSEHRKEQISQVYKIYNMDIENGRFFKRTGQQQYQQRTNKRTDLQLDDIDDEEVSTSSPIKQINALKVLDSFHFEKDSNEKILIEEPEESKRTIRTDKPEVYFQRLTPVAKEEKTPSQSRSTKTQASVNTTKSHKSNLAEKDVYSMVKHLEEEQQRKRIDLHKIYRQTGLSSKARKLNR